MKASSGTAPPKIRDAGPSLGVVATIFVLLFLGGPGSSNMKVKKSEDVL